MGDTPLKCRVHHEAGVDRISLEDIYIFGFHRIPSLQRYPIEIADSNHITLSVGQQLTSSRGGDSRAIFRSISLSADCALENYISILIGEFELLFF